MSDTQETRDAFTPAVITDLGSSRPVSEQTQKLVEEGKKAGIAPLDEPTESTAMHPRQHLPKYAGKMRGVLPDNHPEVVRRNKELAAQKQRERERDAAVRAVESAVPQKLRLGTRVVITGNAKVDYEDKETGERVKGDYAGIEGQVYQTYVDDEGNRRYIITDPDEAKGGKSKYAPAGVRECDLAEIGRREGGSRYVTVSDPERDARLAAERRERFANMSQEEAERATFGGRTAAELADIMCGL